MKKLVTYIALLVTAILISSCTSSVRFGSENKVVKNSQKETAKTNSKSPTEKSVNFSTIPKEKSLSGEAISGEIFSGKASYYGDEFHGRKTASGEVYDKNELTAAHRTLPFGTKVRVLNLKNGNEVVVVINDRGPFKGDRILDLSYSAALALDMIEDGVIEIEFIVLDN